MKARIYADTPVLGGCEDDEFREPSRAVDLKRGYPLLEIRSRREVPGDE